MALRVTNLAVLAGLVIVVSAAAADERSNTLPPPGIRSNAAWLTLTTGATDPLQSAPQLWAITPPRSNLDALVPFDVLGGLKDLEAKSALLWATMSGTGGPTDVYRPVAWPPRLSDFRVDHSWEGQPLRRIQQRLLWIAADGWRLDIRVYFGTERPSKALLVAVQAELKRLTLPSP